jgi:hypothetical protein
MSDKFIGDPPAIHPGLQDSWGSRIDAVGDTTTRRADKPMPKNQRLLRLRYGLAAIGSLITVLEWSATQLHSQELRFRQRMARPQAMRKTAADTANESDKEGDSLTWLDAQDMSGASEESERAVELALAWLAEHQFPTGGWSFDHRLGPCQGRCSNPGTPLAKAVSGATAMALLPLIGHGNTHQTGAYRQNVAAGLQFLITRMRSDGSLCPSDAANLYPASMYSQALGILVLCEDLRICKEESGQQNDPPSAGLPAARGKKVVRPAMSHAKGTARAVVGRQLLQQQQQRELLDRLVPLAASKSLAFSLACQDPRRGGWRYDPLHPDSDISVTGWHVVALHSATAVGLPVPPRTFAGVTAFLNSVQGNFGAVYGYQNSAAEATPARSSMGLLCRVYTGWNRQQLQRGVEILAAVGPSEYDMYYNYYATLLLHHYGGPLWDQWNRKLRDYLVRSQSHNGHETGSWSFRPCQSNQMGGRHFDTCMACLILETYYRSKPVYTSPQMAEKKSADSGYSRSTANHRNNDR